MEHPGHLIKICPRTLQGVRELKPLERVQKMLEIQWGVLDTEMIYMIQVIFELFDI